MVDHLHGDAAAGRARERAGDIAIERGPGVLVDLGFQRGLERLVGVLRAEEIGVADEEILLVVSRVNEPGGDAFGVVGADLAGVWIEHVDALDPHLNIAICLLYTSPSPRDGLLSRMPSS